MTHIAKKINEYILDEVIYQTPSTIIWKVKNIKLRIE